MSFVNDTNNQFIQTRVNSKEGVTCSGQKGGGYGSTMSSLEKSDNAGLGNTYPLVDKHYNNCQKGGAHDYDGDYGSVSYGFTKSGAEHAGTLRGSYAPISKLKSSNMCGGKKRRKKNKSKKKKSKRKSLKSKSRSKTRSKSRSRTRSNVRRNKGKKNQFATPSKVTRSRLGGKRRRRRTRRRTRRRRRHRGGAYQQYASNEAHSAGYSSPNTFGSMPWATGPVSKVRYVNSYDNYNHYKN